MSSPWDFLNPAGAATNVAQAVVQTHGQGPNVKSGRGYANAMDFFDQNYPTYSDAYDPKSMSIYGDVKKKLDGATLDRTGLNRLKGEAMRHGSSPWARLARGQQFAEEANARERGAQEVAGQTAQARSNLAMRGGLSSGASERAAQAGSRNYLNMSQDVGRQGALNRMNVDVQDEQNRVQQLSQVPGMEAAANAADLNRIGMDTNAHQYDITNQINENNNKYKYNMDRFGIMGSVYGADRTAQATENAGKK